MKDKGERRRREERESDKGKEYMSKVAVSDVTFNFMH